MTRFNCKLTNINKVVTTTHGIAEPLCHFCVNSECSNPIENRDVFICGIKKNMRLYIRGDNDPSLVVNCEGFMPEE